MKVAIFAPYDLASHGGIASHIRAQARALRRLGHIVAVYGPASAPLADGETALCGSIAITLGGTASGVAIDPRVFPRVGRVFAREAYDIVHVHEPLMPLLAWAAVLRSPAPVVGTFHVYREDGHAWYPFARPVLDRIVRRIDVRIAVSDAARDTVARTFPGHYEIVPNGIEPQRFTRDHARPAALPPGPVVLYVGRLEPRKGVGAAIDAMAAVQQRVPGATLVVVGDGPDRDALEARALRAGVRVTWANAVGDAALPAFYQWSDVVCAPALSGESFGIVLIEALAAGKPVVASRIPGYVAAAGDCAAVHWTQPGDGAAIAAAVVDLLEDGRRSWHADATRAAGRYDWTLIAERLTALYRRVQRPQR